MQAPLERLSRALSKLPGIGRKTADRMALKLAYNRDSTIRELVGALNEVSASVRSCSRCGAVTLIDADPCRICTDSSRDGSILYVVEDPSDVVAIENTGVVRGRYHVLAGKLSPMDSKGPWDLRLEKLLKRIDEEKFAEVILALGTDMASDTTASFIHELLKDRGLKVTRLALGLPVGSGIAYSDPVTLERAIGGRQAM
ncbi:MAG: recombination mediator RecR [bacterium]